MILNSRGLDITAAFVWWFSAPLLSLMLCYIAARWKDNDIASLAGTASAVNILVGGFCLSLGVANEVWCWPLGASIAFGVLWGLLTFVGFGIGAIMGEER